MKPVLVALLTLVLASVMVSAGQTPQTFTGIITDDACPLGDHTRMRMGPTDAECVRACILSHGASYVLYDGKRALNLSNQELPAEFAAQRVSIVGTLDAETLTIRVQSIAPVAPDRDR
jgi:hypothetical protein